MKRNQHQKYSILLAFTVISFGHITAVNAGADPIETAKTLNALLAISNETIPESSSCQGDYGQQGKATVRDLLATQLAYLYKGKNMVQGNCAGKHCTVSITHSSGEDVSSAIVKFERVRGKANTATLECVITP